MRNTNAVVREIMGWNCDDANVLASLLNELEKIVGWHALGHHVDLHNLPTQDVSQISTDDLWAVDRAGFYVASALDEPGVAFKIYRVENWR